MTTSLLNPYQRNSVTSTLCSLEATLRTAIPELKTRENGILYSQKVTLTDTQFEQIKQTIHVAMGEISHLAKTLNLPVEIRNSRTDLQGQLSVLWSDLQEIRAKNLRGYGEVAPGLETVLDPSVLHLIELVSSLMRIISA